MSAPTFPDFPPVIRQDPYTLALRYTAPGQGRLVQVMVTLAPDRELATLRFRVTFYPTTTPSAWLYLRQALAAHDGVHRPVLSHWFTAAMVDHIEREAHHHQFIHFHWSFNGGGS